MLNFIYKSPTRVIFGKNTQYEAGKHAVKYGKRVLIHYSGVSQRIISLVETVKESLKNEGLEFIELGGVQPNPRLGLVRKGIDLCRSNNIEHIIAIGGGSVIDSAKAIAIGVPYEGDVWDFFTGKTPTETIPVGVILTIAAAGSEAANGTVITNEDGWYKKSVNNEVIIPKYAILNPELTFSVPAYQTGCGVTDIIAHVMENYFSSTPNVELTDRLCEAVMKTAINNGRIVMQKPDDYDARAEIMWAGTIAQMGFLNMGRQGDWASHLIEHEISGIYNIAHGAGLAAVFPAWMKYVHVQNIDKFVQFAQRVWEVDETAFDSKEDIAQEGIKRTVEFFREIGMPVTLKELKVPNERFEEMAEKCTEYGPLGNFKLNRQDVINIFNLAQ